MDVTSELFKLKDEKYKSFSIKLIPNIDESIMIGVRIPDLKKFAKKLKSNDFPCYYFEEKMLHGFYIAYSNLSFENKLKLLDDFIFKIDNWSVCDSVCSSFKFINKNKKEFLSYLKKYFNYKDEFVQRFVIVILKDYYLDGEYIDFTFNYLKNLKTNSYYANMALSWAFAEIYVNYSEKIIDLFKNNKIDENIKRITISKINDSKKIDKAKKELINQYK